MFYWNWGNLTIALVPVTCIIRKWIVPDIKVPIYIMIDMKELFL